MHKKYRLNLQQQLSRHTLLNMKWSIVGLCALFVLLQWKLWFGAASVPDAIHLHRLVTTQQQENSQLIERNQVLAAEVRDLKHGEDAIEERARTELGMVKMGEVFYQIVD